MDWNVEKTHTDMKKRGNAGKAELHLEPYCYGDHAANGRGTNTGCKIKCRLVDL